MSEAVANEIPPAVVRRVELADLNVIGPWLIRRLQDKHPNASPQQILGWLRGCIASNDHFFVRTDWACALAEVRRHPLQVQPDAWELFCFADSDEWRYEAADLYPRMASWAANLQCERLHVDIWTDVSRTMMASRLGSLSSHRHAFIPLQDDP